MAGKQKPNPLMPSLTLLCKIGSLLVHADEAGSAGGHPFDMIAFLQIKKDPEFISWMQAMDKAGLLPVRRSPVESPEFGKKTSAAALRYQIEKDKKRRKGKR